MSNISTASHRCLVSIIQTIARMASKAGLSRDDWIDLTRAHYPAVVEGAVSVDDSPEAGSQRDFRDTLGLVLSLWRIRPDYCDEFGESTAVPIWGPPPSVETLYRDAQRRYPDSSAVPFAEALAVLFENQALAPVDGDKAIPKMIAFSINNERSADVSGQLAYLAEFISTVDFNTDVPAGQGRFQMMCSTSNFPVSHLPILNEFLHTNGVDVVRHVDDLIEEIAAESHSGKTTRVGVGLYEFIDDAPASQDK